MSDAVDQYLLELVDEGVLAMGADPVSGEIVFWSAPKKAVVV